MPLEKTKQTKEGCREADEVCAMLNRAGWVVTEFICTPGTPPFPALQVIPSECKQIEWHPYKDDLDSL